MRTSLRAILVLTALVCGAHAVPVQAAPEEPTAAAVRLPPLADALVEASASGKPVLLLVGLPRADCPPVVRLEEQFLSGEPFERVKQLAVPARLVVGGPNPSPEVLAFSKRYGIPSTPAFFVLAPDGDLLHAQFGGLYGVYAEDQTLMNAPLVSLLAADDLLGILRAAITRDAAQRARLAATVATTAPAEMVERAEILAARARKGEALVEARRAAGFEVPADLGLRLARVLRDADASADAAAFLARLADRQPKHRDRALWDVLAKAYDPTLAGAAPWPDLIRAARADGRAAALALAEVHAVLQDPAALQALEADRRPMQAWFAALTLLPVEGEAALSELANRAAGPRSRLEAMERLLATFPEAASAQHGKHGMLDLLRRQAALTAESAPR